MQCLYLRADDSEFTSFLLNKNTTYDALLKITTSNGQKISKERANTRIYLNGWICAKGKKIWVKELVKDTWCGYWKRRFTTYNFSVCQKDPVVFSLLVINSLKLQKHKFIEIVAIIQSKYLNPFYVYGPSPLFSVIFIISSPMLQHPVLISILCPYIWFAVTFSIPFVF